MSAPPVLEVRGVTKAYGDREVLRGIDLEVGEHRALALIGASGFGTSTPPRCIDLLEDIDDGDILLDGEVITDPSRPPVGVRRRLGLVVQAFNLFPHLSVIGNVVLAPSARAACRAPRRSSGGAGCWRASGWAVASTTTPTASPAASSSASRSSALTTEPRALPPDEGHERARPRAGGRGARAGARAEGGRNDHGDRHPRDGLRPRRRR